MMRFVQTSNTSSRVQTILLLRWVLVIATAYLMLFSRPLAETPPGVALFVAGYFASNIVFGELLRRTQRQRLLDAAIVLFDSVAICGALALTNNVSTDFFLLYFLVVFLGALTQRLGLVVAAAVLASVVHLVTLSQFVDNGELMRSGYMVRVPFLLVVALFFGHLVQDEAQARDQIRFEFLSSVSHDLKNPLAVIQSLAELLLDGNAGPLNRDQAQLTRRIYVSARNVVALSNNLLNAARIEAGRLTVQRSPEDLADVVRGSVSFARSASDLKGIVLEFCAEPNLPPVDIDRIQIERVVSNLLDNAIKYTPTGGSVLASVIRDGDQLVLAVRDDGPGIPVEDLPMFFEKYRRRRSREGSGVGLFIVKAIVEAHGGTVGVESEIDKGTIVSVILPIGEPSRMPSPDVAPRARLRTPPALAATVSPLAARRQTSR